MDRSAELIWRIVLGAAALMGLGFFLFSLQPTVGPFILFLVLLALLTPFRGWPGHALLVTVTSLLMLFWVLVTTGFLLAPFALALVLAYIFDPLVDVLEGRGLARSLAVVLLALPAAIGLVVALLVGVPAFVGQIGDLIEQAPPLLNRFAEWAEGLDQRVEWVTLPAFDPDALVSVLQERQAVLVQGVWDAVLGLGRGLGSALSIVGYVVLTPIITFYLLRDWDALTTAAAGLSPLKRRKAVLSFLGEYDRLLSRYFRGQLTVALAVGLITVVGLWISGFPHALLLGAIVAVFSVVPYLGLVLSLIPAVFIALVSGDVGIMLLKVAIVYGAAQLLEGIVISPRIVGESVGLHPVWIVLALAMGGYFFGFVGLLIGVPLAVGVKLLVLAGLARYRESRLFQEQEARPENG